MSTRERRQHKRHREQQKRRTELQWVARQAAAQEAALPRTGQVRARGAGPGMSVPEREIDLPEDSPGRVTAGIVAVLIALGVGVAWSIAAGQKESDAAVGQLMGSWLAVYALGSTVLSVAAGIRDLDQARWVHPRITTQILKLIPVNAGVGAAALLVSGRSYAQLAEFGGDDMPALGVLFVFFVFFIVCGLLGFVVVGVVVQPISQLLAAMTTEENYAVRARGIMLMPTRATGAARSIALLSGITHALLLWRAAHQLGVDDPDGYGTPIARAVVVEISWLTSGDVSPISILAWISLAGFVGSILLWIVAATRAGIPAIQRERTPWWNFFLFWR